MIAHGTSQKCTTSGYRRLVSNTLTGRCIAWFKLLSNILKCTLRCFCNQTCSHITVRHLQLIPAAHTLLMSTMQKTKK